MKKSILDFGRVLSKSEQQQIKAKGNVYWCTGGNSHTTNK